MEIDEITALLRPFAGLNHQQLADTLTYLDLLQKWNSRINLTGIRSSREVITRHFGESFFAAQTLLSKDYASTIIDLGSGAGFPGVPIAMFAPTAKVTLIESNSKKAAFLNEVIRVLDLENASVFSHRAEEYSQTSRLVVLRAVEKFAVSLKLASRLVEPGGRLAVMMGHEQTQEAISMVPRCRWQEAVPVPESRSRVLLAGIL